MKDLYITKSGMTKRVRILAVDQKQALRIAKKIAEIKTSVLQSTGAVIMDACSEVAPYPGLYLTGMVKQAGPAMVTMSILAPFSKSGKILGLQRMGVRILALDQNQAFRSAKMIAGLHWVVRQSTGALVTTASCEDAPFPDQHQTGMLLM